MPGGSFKVADNMSVTFHIFQDQTVLVPPSIIHNPL